MRRLLPLSALTLSVSLAACGGSGHSVGSAEAVVHSPPSGFVVQPEIADPVCNGGRGVSLRAGLGGDAVVASATMSDGSAWISFSEIYPGKRYAVLRSVRRDCAPDLQFGHDGIATIKIVAGLQPAHPAALGSPAEGLWVNVIAPRNGGGAIVAGTYGGAWVVGEVTRRGRVDTAFGNSGWTVLPFRGEVSAVVQLRSGQILIGGDNGGGGCCTSNWAAALSARGQLVSGFGRQGRAPLPTGEDSGVRSLALEPNGDILAEIGYGNMGCWGTALAMLTPAGKPAPLFKTRLDRFWRELDFGAFVGDTFVDDHGFTLVGTGQKPCADGPSFSARSATGLVAGFGTDGRLVSPAIRFPSRLYGDLQAFTVGKDTFVVGSPYADPTRIAVTALRPDGSTDPNFGSHGRVLIRTPWRGSNAALDTGVSITRAGQRVIVIVATRPGKLQLIRVRL